MTRRRYRVIRLRAEGSLILCGASQPIERFGPLAPPSSHSSTHASMLAATLEGPSDSSKWTWCCTETAIISAESSRSTASTRMPQSGLSSDPCSSIPCSAMHQCAWQSPPRPCKSGWQCASWSADCRRAMISAGVSGGRGSSSGQLAESACVDGRRFERRVAEPLRVGGPRQRRSRYRTIECGPSMCSVQPEGFESRRAVTAMQGRRKGTSRGRRVAKGG